MPSNAAHSAHLTTMTTAETAAATATAASTLAAAANGAGGHLLPRGPGFHYHHYSHHGPGRMWSRGFGMRRLVWVCLVLSSLNHGPHETHGADHFSLSLD